MFFGFSPLLGLHTIGALAVAFVFNLNRVAVLLGVYSNLPWIIVPYYALATMLGALLLRTRLPEGFRERLVDAFALSLLAGASSGPSSATLLEPLFWPFMVGSHGRGPAAGRRRLPGRAGVLRRRRRIYADAPSQRATALPRAQSRSASASAIYNSAVLLVGSFWRKLLVAVVAAAGFVWLYEATMLDSKDAAGDATIADMMPPPEPGTRLTFTATAYCKGAVTAAGVAPLSGVAAADPTLLPLGSVVEIDSPDSTLRRHLHGARHRTGRPGTRGRPLHVELPRGARASAGSRSGLTVLRLGWNPEGDGAGLHGPPLPPRRRRAARRQPSRRRRIRSRPAPSPADAGS